MSPRLPDISSIQTSLHSTMAQRKLSNKFYGAGLAVMAVAFAVFPLYIQKPDHNLTRQDKPLSGHQIMRGAYLNTGSRDAGPDPDWDMATGTYKGKSSFNPSTEDVQRVRREIVEQRARKQLGISGAEQAPAAGGKQE